MSKINELIVKSMCFIDQWLAVVCFVMTASVLRSAASLVMCFDKTIQI